MTYAAIADAIPRQLSLGELDEALAQTIAELDEESYTKAQQVIDLVSDCTDFFIAPASAKFHLNEEGGLYRHSLGVTYRLFALDAAYDLFSEYSKLEVFLVGFLHDLGKAGQVSLAPVIGDGALAPQVAIGTKFYRSTCEPYYIKKFFKTKPGEYEYKRNPERVAMSIPMSSLHFIGTVLSDIWKPSAEAWAAISFHDGQYVPEGKHVAHGETKLGLALHHSDMWQCRTEASWEISSWAS